MNLHEQAEAAFNKIIKQGRTAAIRKTAEAYWKAYNTDAGVSEEDGKNLEQAIKSIQIDFRQSTVSHLEELNRCKGNNKNISSCYLNFAIAIVDRVIKII